MMDDPWRILSDLGTDGTMTWLLCAAKATGVLASAGLVALAMKRRAAATRHLVWGLGLAGALAVLPLGLALPRWRVPVLETPVRAEPPIVSSSVSEVRPSEGPAVMEMHSVSDDALATARRASPIESNGTEAPRVAWPLVV